MGLGRRPGHEHHDYAIDLPDRGSTRCRDSWTTVKLPALMRTAHATAEPLRPPGHPRCWPAPGTGSVSCASCEAGALVRSDGWHGGCGSRSASSATTATCPLHPHLLELLQDWQAARHADTVHRPAAVPATAGRLNRHVVARIRRPCRRRRRARARAPAPAAPHVGRHERSTAACGIEAIGAMLGHRSLRMTLIYARIANRTVADEYRARQRARRRPLRRARTMLGSETAEPMRRLRQRASADARQRLMRHDRPSSTAAFESDLRRLRVLRQITIDFRSDTARPARRRRATGPGRPRRDLPEAPRRPRQPSRMTQTPTLGQALRGPADHRHIPLELDRITGISAVLARVTAAATDRWAPARYRSSTDS